MPKDGPVVITINDPGTGPASGPAPMAAGDPRPARLGPRPPRTPPPTEALAMASPPPNLLAAAAAASDACASADATLAVAGSQLMHSFIHF